jgi:aquaporin NIP
VNKLQVPLYIGTQVLASICASYTLKGVFHPFMNGGVTVPSVEYGQAFALEFIISFNLMFVVTAVATDTRAVSIYINYYHLHILL